MRKFSGRTVAAIVEFPNDKILLVKRGTVVFKGYWAIPGGRIEVGESVEEALLREVKEETGLDVRIVRKIGEYVEKGISDRIEYEYYPTVFLVQPLNNDFKKQEDEIKDIRLFNINEVPEILAFEHKKIIEDYVKSGK